VRLAATDPANPYGAILGWSDVGQKSDNAAPGMSLMRTVGAIVILINGSLAAYLRKGNPQIAVFLPEDEPQHSQTAKALAEELHKMALEGDRHGGLLIEEVNGVVVAEHPFAHYLREVGFIGSALGYSVRRSLYLREPAVEKSESETEEST